MKEKLLFPWNFSVEVPVEKDGRTWTLRASGKAGEERLETNLDDDTCWLEWRELYGNPKEALMHLYIFAPQKNPHFSTKFYRMTNWQDAIKTYGDLAILDNFPEPQDAAETLRQKLLPRPETIIFNTTTRGLKDLFATLGMEHNPFSPHVYKIGWEKLLEMSLTGEIVETWLNLKQKAA